ncbi:MAG: hypothetical protein LBV54_05985 [Puniceicoccales bacterium]|jgi:hypothetical protein|nr:hypothetical protein [Puniceicoccales bacterium]
MKKHLFIALALTLCSSGISAIAQSEDNTEPQPRRTTRRDAQVSPSAARQRAARASRGEDTIAQEGVPQSVVRPRTARALRAPSSEGGVLLSQNYEIVFSFSEGAKTQKSSVFTAKSAFQVALSLAESTPSASLTGTLLEQNGSLQLSYSFQRYLPKINRSVIGGIPRSTFESESGKGEILLTPGKASTLFSSDGRNYSIQITKSPDSPIVKQGETPTPPKKNYLLTLEKKYDGKTNTRTVFAGEETSLLFDFFGNNIEQSPNRASAGNFNAALTTYADGTLALSYLSGRDGRSSRLLLKPGVAYPIYQNTEEQYVLKIVPAPEPTLPTSTSAFAAGKNYRIKLVWTENGISTEATITSTIGNHVSLRKPGADLGLSFSGILSPSDDGTAKLEYSFTRYLGSQRVTTATEELRSSLFVRPGIPYPVSQSDTHSLTVTIDPVD